MSYLDTRELADELDTLEGEDEGALDTDEIERRDAIRELFEGLSGYSGDDPRDGITLIPDDEFEEYARELAEDIGAVPDGLGWPLTCIDWSQAADELRTDYTSATFDGTDYLYR